jgi:hypothetical protein
MLEIGERLLISNLAQRGVSVDLETGAIRHEQRTFSRRLRFHIAQLLPRSETRAQRRIRYHDRNRIFADAVGQMESSQMTSAVELDKLVITNRR